MSGCRLEIHFWTLCAIFFFACTLDFDCTPLQVEGGDSEKQRAENRAQHSSQFADNDELNRTEGLEERFDLFQKQRAKALAECATQRATDKERLGMLALEKVSIAGGPVCLIGSFILTLQELEDLKESMTELDEMFAEGVSLSFPS
ncbi:hypothetical protein IW262DRAFT_1462529 [Armillaria fumosa]|nr:hypothetical protein IW262DRAFT_1462529 [Armillaria fumosa]